MAALIFSVIPGIVQIHKERCAKGVILFFLFAFALNAFFLIGIVWAENDGQMARTVAAIGAALVWLWAFIDAIRLVRSPVETSAGGKEPGTHG